MRSIHHQHGDTLVMSDGGGGSVNPLMTATEFERTALHTFYLFMFAHINSFILAQLSIRLKSYHKRHFLAQLLHMLSILPYGISLYYTIWFVMLNWSVVEDKELNFYERWLFMEAVWHYVWLICCAVFMLICYLFKVKPILA